MGLPSSGRSGNGAIGVLSRSLAVRAFSEEAALLLPGVWGCPAAARGPGLTLCLGSRAALLLPRVQD